MGTTVVGLARLPWILRVLGLEQRTNMPRGAIDKLKSVCFPCYTLGKRATDGGLKFILNFVVSNCIFKYIYGNFLPG